MSDADAREEPAEAKVLPAENDKIVIALPYAIANMVSIETLPFFILVAFGANGFFRGGFASGEPLNQVAVIWIGSAVLGAIGLLVLKRTLWRRAIEGRSVRLPLSLFSTSSECYLVPSYCSFRLPPSRTSSCRRGAGCSCPWFFAGYSGCWR